MWKKIKKQTNNKQQNGHSIKIPIKFLRRRRHCRRPFAVPKFDVTVFTTWNLDGKGCQDLN